MKKAKTKQLENIMARAANIKRLDAKLKNLQKKAIDYREYAKRNAIESKKVTTNLAQDRMKFLSELIKETGYPIENIAPIVGAAIEFTEILKDGSSEEKEKLTHYIDTFNQFAQSHELNIEVPQETATDEENSDTELEEIITDEDEE